MKARRHDFYADDWLAGTLELKPYDRGVYITICALIYSRGESIGVELLARHCGVHRNQLNASIRRLVAAGKIEESATSLRQVRCETEIFLSDLRLKKWAENLPQFNKNSELPLPRGGRATRDARKISTKEDKILNSDSDPVRADARLGGGVDDLVAGVLATVQAKVAAPYVGKRDQWLNNLAAFVSDAFDGNARMEAWQAIEDARAAESRKATPPHIRRAIDEIDKLFRAAGTFAEAAE